VVSVISSIQIPHHGTILHMYLLCRLSTYISRIWYAADLVGKSIWNVVNYHHFSGNCGWLTMTTMQWF